MFKSSATVFVLLGVMVASVFTLDCYTCKSQNDPGCASPLDETAIETVECTTNIILDENVCIAYTAILNNEPITLRSCDSTKLYEPCEYAESLIAGQGGILTNCYYCYSDKCNAADV